MPKVLEDLEKVIENSTGYTVEELRQKTIDELRREMLNKGKDMKFNSFKPFIGRGSVIDNFLSSEEINTMVDACLS